MINWSYILIFILLVTQTTESEWQFQYEKDGVKIFTKDVAGSAFDAFKGEMVMDASLSEIFDVIMDIENYSKWCYRTSSTEIVKRDSNKIFYRYVSETPAMVKNREGYFYSEIEENNHTDHIKISLGVFESNKQVPSGFVRIPESTGYWELTAVNKQKTKVIFEMQAEAGGIVPGWLSNIISTESPWVTMTNLDKLIKEKRR